MIDEIQRSSFVNINQIHERNDGPLRHSPLLGNAMDTLRVSPHPLSISSCFSQLLEHISQFFQYLFPCCCCFGSDENEETSTSILQTTLVDPIPELVGATQAEQQLYEDLLELKRIVEREERLTPFYEEFEAFSALTYEFLQNYITDNRNDKTPIIYFYQQFLQDTSVTFQMVRDSNIPALTNQYNKFSRDFLVAFPFIEEERQWAPLQELIGANALEQKIYEDFIKLKRIVENNTNVPIELNRKLQLLAEDALKDVQEYIDNNRNSTSAIMDNFIVHSQRNGIIEAMIDSDIIALMFQYVQIEEDIQNLSNQ